MPRNPDDTIILQPLRKRRAPLPALIIAAAALLLSLAGGTAWLLRPPPPPAIPTATEAVIQAESPAARTVLRFAPNPAIIVIDFPTLAEQGHMLNRVAAWAEKAGVPHDRLLTDDELAAAIRASGTTSDTYYYGHDYRGTDIARFFALADTEHLALHAEEEQLRQLSLAAATPPTRSTPPRAAPSCTTSCRTASSSPTRPTPPPSWHSGNP
jgi:hypothetical protein